MNLFLYLPWKRKYAFLRQNSNNVVIYYKDMNVLLWSFVSCSNLFLMMVMDGSAGTDVYRTFIS